MLRDYQNSGVASLRAEYAAGRTSPLYVLPTGGGKTFVFCYIAQQITARARRAVILVHRQELLNQASRSLRSMGVAHGLIAPGYPEDREQIQIASVQALRARLKKLTPEQIAKRYDFDLIIIDEAHHAVAGSWRTIVMAINKAKLLGVTATACRSDGKGLGAGAGGIFDSIVIGPSVSELIKKGHLVQPIVYAPPNRIDMAGVHMRGGDYNSKELAEAVDKPTITGDAVAHYARLCPFKPAVAFCASVAHAEHVAEQFRAAGFRSQALDGKAGDAERRAVINGLTDGSVHVLTSCDIVSEGTDIPAIEAAILLRPTQSTGLYLQQVGRALRPAPGKTRALILDHVGNCGSWVAGKWVPKHGFPDEEREWSLDGLDKRKRQPGEQPEMKLKQCTECYAYHEAAPACPECGHEYPVGGRGEIDQVSGELRELTKDEMEAIRRQARVTQGAAKTLDELIAIGAARGYKNPKFWAQHVLKGRRQ